MPTIKRTTVLAANAAANPLTGSQYEYLPFAAKIEACIMAIAPSVATADMFSGSDVLLEQAPLDGLALATPLEYPFHFHVEDVAAAGERLGLTIRDVSGAGTTVRTIVKITPL